MSQVIIIKSLQDKIEFISQRDCEGCSNFYASFKNHSCYIDTWCTKLLKHLDEAIEFVPDANKYNKDFLFNILLNGTTND